MGKEAEIISIAKLRPIFVVGMNGSGTTMLVDCLSRHPEVYGHRLETRLIPYFIKRLPRYGDLSKDANFLRLWKDVTGIPAFVRANRGNRPDIPENWQEFPRTLASPIDCVMRGFARSQGKRRWCEKTPQNVQHIESLFRLFPNAQFIHIIRDGRACAASFHRRWGRTPEYTIYRWRKTVSTGRKQGAAMPDAHYLEIRYEELTTDPERWLKACCRFLDIDFEKGASSEERKTSFLESIQQIRPRPNRFSNHFDGKRLARLESIAGNLLQELGYVSCFQKKVTKSEPWTLLRMYWQIKDLTAASLSITQRFGRARLRGRRVSLIEKLRVAVGQMVANKY